MLSSGRGPTSVPPDSSSTDHMPADADVSEAEFSRAADMYLVSQAGARLSREVQARSCRAAALPSACVVLSTAVLGTLERIAPACVFAVCGVTCRGACGTR